MEEQFLIQTERLLLRPLVVNDAEAMFAYRSLPGVALFQSWQPESVEAVLAFLRENESTPFCAPNAWYQVAICLPDGRLIGDIGIHTLEHNQLELGYTLSPAFQGHGYASEAVGAILREAFTRWNTHRVIASVDPANAASIRLLDRLGFRKEAHHIKSYRMRGKWYDDCVYAILHEEYCLRLSSIDSVANSKKMIALESEEPYRNGN